MDGPMDGSVERWADYRWVMDGWMDEWIGGWVDGWIKDGGWMHDGCMMDA